MKKVFSTLVIAMLAIVSTTAFAQKAKTKTEDKSKRPSKPVVVTQTIASGAKITIDYSQPILKGRTIGKDVEPMEGKIWRAGANEATVFETSTDVTVEGSPLPKGKYAFFAIKNEDFWTLIFNKTWKTWGAYDYEKNKANDVLIVKVRVAPAPKSFEKLTYTIAKDGQVTLGWGNELIRFKVK